MTSFAKPLLAVCFSLFLQSASATPNDDARLIAERQFDISFSEMADEMLSKAFVAAYFSPLAGQGIEIASEEKFIALIPDEDLAPYVERAIASLAENIQATLTVEQMAVFADLLRADRDLTISDWQSFESEQAYMIALEEARAQALVLETDDPKGIAAMELVVRLEAFNAMMEDGGAEALAQSARLVAGTFFAILGAAREIKEIKMPLDNPVTIAAMREEGVLRFSNPVHRQTMLRQVTSSDRPTGIQFIKPPARSTESD